MERLRTLPLLARLTALTLVATAFAVAYGAIVLADIADPLLPALGAWVGLVLVAVLVAAGWRWAPVVAVVVSAALFWVNWPAFLYDLTYRTTYHYVLFEVILTTLLAFTIVAGSAAAVQNARGTRTVPRWIAALLWALVGAAGGALLVGALPVPQQHDRGAPLLVSDAATLAALPTITGTGMRFVPDTWRVRAGEPVVLRLHNPDSSHHHFDLDAFGIHQEMPPGETIVLLFTPTEPGTYPFYCGVPSHRQAGMVGTLIVEP